MTALTPPPSYSASSSSHPNPPAQLAATPSGSKFSLSSFLRRPAVPPPTKTTFTLPASNIECHISCTTSTTQPSYHIPSALTTSLGYITLSSTTATSSALPTYREVFKLQRLPFVGYQLNAPGTTRAQIHHIRSHYDVFLYTKLAGLVASKERPALRAKRGKITDAVTGNPVAKMFDYKTGGGEKLRALEFVGDAEDRKLRDLVIALWMCVLWDSERPPVHVSDAVRVNTESADVVARRAVF